MFIVNGGRAPIREGCPVQHPGDIDATSKGTALRHPWARCRRDALEGIFLGHFDGRLRQGSADLVVRQVGLARVREDGKDGGNSLRRAGLTGRDHYLQPQSASPTTKEFKLQARVFLTDAQLHKVIIHRSASPRLDDVDIFAPHRVFDLTARLPHREFAEDAIAWRNPQDVADAVYQRGVGITSENNNISDHGDSLCLCWVVDVEAGKYSGKDDSKAQ